MKKLIVLLLSALSCTLTYGQATKDLNIKFMLRGYFYAQSSVLDSLALGGFGGSNNLPKEINDTSNFTKNAFYLKIDTTKSTVFAEDINGYVLYVINSTGKVVRLEAQDSRLNISAEAFVNNTWQAIEYLPSSWCGNSYHTLHLKNGEYWEFAIPKYDGRIKTKLRYTLRLENGDYIYSNSIIAGINKKQLTEKQGHTALSIMDPYDE